MKFYEFSLTVLFTFISIGFVISAINYVYDEYWREDNEFDEIFEKKIEEHKENDKDLTQNSKENKY